MSQRALEPERQIAGATRPGATASGGGKRDLDLDLIARTETLFVDE